MAKMTDKQRREAAGQKPYATPTSPEIVFGHAKYMYERAKKKPTPEQVHSAKAAGRRKEIVNSIPPLKALTDALTSKPKKKKP